MTFLEEVTMTMFLVCGFFFFLTLTILLVLASGWLTWAIFDWFTEKRRKRK